MSNFLFQMSHSNLGYLPIFFPKSKRVSNPGNSGSKLESPEKSLKYSGVKTYPRASDSLGLGRSAILLFLKAFQVILIRELLT